MEQHTPGTLFNLKIKGTVVTVLFGIGAALCVLFIKYSTIRTELTFVAAIIGGLSIVYSGYYVGLTLRENIRRDKLHRSFEFTQKLNSIDRARIRGFINEQMSHKEHIVPAKFHDAVVSDPELHTAVKALLGLFEDASLAVQHQYVDELVLYKSLAFVVPWASQTFAPFIAEERRDCERQSLFCELDKLADAWKMGKSLLTNEQFPKLTKC